MFAIRFVLEMVGPCGDGDRKNPKPKTTDMTYRQLLGYGFKNWSQEQCEDIVKIFKGPSARAAKYILKNKYHVQSNA